MKSGLSVVMIRRVQAICYPIGYPKEEKMEESKILRNQEKEKLKNEKLQKHHEKLKKRQKHLEQLVNRSDLKIMRLDNSIKEIERRERTRALIEIGATLCKNWGLKYNEIDLERFEEFLKNHKPSEFEKNEFAKSE